MTSTLKCQTVNPAQMMNHLSYQGVFTIVFCPLISCMIMVKTITRILTLQFLPAILRSPKNQNITMTRVAGWWKRFICFYFDYPITHVPHWLVLCTCVLKQTSPQWPNTELDQKVHIKQRCATFPYYPEVCYFYVPSSSQIYCFLLRS